MVVRGYLALVEADRLVAAEKLEEIDAVRHADR
jgi:hypothetical protein